MTATAGDVIATVIVPVVALAFWLGMMFYASSHPQWGSQAPADAVPSPGTAGTPINKEMSWLSQNTWSSTP